MTTTVFFDFYGTLAEAQQWGGTSIFELIEAAGHEVPDHAADWWAPHRFDGVDHRRHSASRETYLEWERGHRREFLTTCGIPDDVAAAILRQFEETLGDHVLRAYDEVPDVLTELGRRGVQRVICSNWDWDLDRAVQSAGLSHLIDAQVTSAQAGARKPHPHIYAHTLEVAGCAVSEVLFVGDTLGPDLEGPVRAGMRAALVWRDDPDFRSRRPEPPAALHDEGLVIRDLTEVLNLI